MRILISGAGIAGPTAAFWLNRAGHSVTLIEHAAELRKGGYLIDFWGAGFDVADRMGIVPELRRRGYIVKEVRTVNSAGRKVASFQPRMIIESVDRYVSIARSDLSAVIYEALAGSVELLLGDSVESLRNEPDRVRVTLRSGGNREFDLVIGADGLHSRVRHLAFDPGVVAEKYLGMVVGAFDAAAYPHRDDLVAMMYAGVGFQALRVSLRNDRTLLLFSVRHDGEVPRDRANQEKLLRQLLSDKGWEVPTMLEAMARAEEFYFDAVSQIRMPVWSTGRVALIGDAVACPSFLAGQGSALAMVEAYTLAAELSRTDDHAEAFDRYSKRLAPLLKSKQDAAEGLGLAFAPKNRMQLAARNTVMRMMALPKVADFAMGRSFHDAIELPAFIETRSPR